jgi:hypothetical protein
MSVSDVVALHVSVISLDHPQGHFSYAKLLSDSGFRHNFSWGCGCIFCLCCCFMCLTAARLVVYCAACRSVLGGCAYAHSFMPQFRPPSPRPALGPIGSLFPWASLQTAAGRAKRNEWSYTSTFPILLLVPSYNSYRFSGIGVYC